MVGLLEKMRLFDDFSYFWPIYSVKIPENKIRVNIFPMTNIREKNIPDGLGKIGKSGIFFTRILFSGIFFTRSFFYLRYLVIDILVTLLDIFPPFAGGTITVFLFF